MQGRKVAYVQRGNRRIYFSAALTAARREIAVRALRESPRRVLDRDPPRCLCTTGPDRGERETPKKIKNERKKDGEDDKDDDDGKSPDQMNKRTEAIMNQLLEMNESEEDLVF